VEAEARLDNESVTATIPGVFTGTRLVVQRRTALSTLGLSTALCVVGAVGTLAYRQFLRVDARARAVSHTHQVLQTADALTIAVRDAAAARRAFALEGDEATLRPYQGALARVSLARAHLRHLTRDNPLQQRRLGPLEQALDARLAQLDEATKERLARGFDPQRELALVARGDSLNSALVALTDEFKDLEQRLLEEREATFRADSARVRRLMVLGFGGSTAILVVAFLLLRVEVRLRRRSESALSEREARLSIILDGIGDGVIATDTAGVITHINPMAARSTGWPGVEAVGRPFQEVFRIINEKTRAAESDPVARVLEEGKAIGLGPVHPVLLLARDGVERPLAHSGAPIFDDRGLRGTVIVFRDVSASRDVEARFRHLVEAAPDAIVISDARGRIVTVNDQATALFGYSADELLGRDVEMLIPDSFRARHVEHRRRYAVAPAVRSMGAGRNLFGRRKDGTELPIEVSLSPVQTPEGLQVIAAVRDVTHRRELERFRDEYVGYISHDLKNPLSVITLQARLLARSLAGHGTAEEKRALGVIADSAASIDRMVRELLEMAYVESGQVELHPEPVALAPFLQSVIDRALSTSSRQRVQLEILAPATVSAESRRLERVVVNFLQNAIKYSPPETPILVRLGLDAGQAKVSVSDHGPGVPPEERASVFEKYKRTSSAKGKEGLGLGLYISRKIVEAHGGDIGVEAGPAGGAAFYFRLPLVAGLAEPRSTAKAPAEAPERGLRGLKVLLVDDEPNAVKALAMLLGDDGLEITAATSGEQALALAESRRPDVAVLDVQMPGMSGLVLLEHLRALHAGLPVVIMTGHLERDAGIVAARARGGVAYVGKPVDVEELTRTLVRVCAPPPDR
jgi:PAS domain S-box-containing protein